MALSSKIRRTLLWSSVDRLGQAALNFIVSILLARLLTPTDFGLMGGVMFFAAISYVLVDSGLGKALARTRNADNTHFTTIFFANILISFLLYAAAFITAPYIARYMDMPELTMIIRVLFISLIFNAFYIVPHTRLQMSFRFDRIACVNLGANVFSAVVAMVAAFNHAGVWALVAQQMSYHAARMAGFLAAGPLFTITRPSLQLLYSTMRFSSHITLAALLNAVFSNIYLFIVAKFFHISQAGQYTHSHRQADNANFTMLAIFEATTYNLLAEQQHHEGHFTVTMRHLMKSVNMVAMPVMMLVIIIAEPACRLLFGEQWLPSVPYFQLICLANITAVVSLLCTNALNVKGMSRITFWLEVLRKSAIALSAALTLQYGIEALLAGYVIASMLGTVAQMIAVHHKTAYSITSQIADLLPAIGITAVTAILWRILL